MLADGVFRFTHLYHALMTVARSEEMVYFNQPG